jgi:hypothetical protein
MATEVSLVLQYCAVGVAVAISAWVVLRKQAPNAERRLRIALAAPLVRETSSTWLRRIGRRIAPEPRTLAGGGSCAGCADRCETDRDREH